MLQTTAQYKAETQTQLPSRSQRSRVKVWCS